MKSCHFIGICGAGMSAVAKLLRDQGWKVSGSDAGFYPPVSDALTRAGLSCKTPHHPDNIPQDAELIVIGKHAKLRPELNDEVKAAFALQDQGRVKVRSFPEILTQLTATTTNIVVAGSYGKSTTTALAAWVLQASGKDPSYFIGAVPLNMEHSSQLGKGKYFLLEGDEYPTSNWDQSSKFLHYNAKVVILTSCEYDHFNEFPSEEAYVDVYRKLVKSIPSDGLLVACLDGLHVAEVAKDANCRVVTYSADMSSDADYCLEQGAVGSALAQAVVHRRLSNGDFERISISSSLFGKHNWQNIVGVAAALLELGAVTSEQFSQAISTFAGLRRRLELKVAANGSSVYEDLSSSRPKAVAALSALREHFPKAALIAVFHPHTFSFRSRKALNWYPGMFADADHVFVLSPPSLKGLPAKEELSSEEIVDAIRAGNDCAVEAIASTDEIVRATKRLLNGPTVIIVMSSGGVSDTVDALVREVSTACLEDSA